MKREESRETEARAAAAVALTIGARARRIDKAGAGDGLRDFDLVFPDGRAHEPLEVSSNTHRWTRVTSDRAARHSWQPADTGRTWLLALPTGTAEPVDVERVRRAAVPALRALEALGVYSFEAPLYGNSAEALTVRFIRDLGVTGGTSAPPTDGVARLGLEVMFGGAVEVDTVAAAVEDVANREDNRAKLRQHAGAARRHLFVLLDWSGGGGTSAWAAREAFERGRMPRLPELPEPITTAWVQADQAVLHVTPPLP